jgi:3-phosphoshikimate 1-carboxyvinyltransferase
MSDSVEVARAAKLHGRIRVPGDKSGSHRALMISALASGTSTIEGLSPGHDVASTSVIMQQLGAARHDDGDLVIITGPEGGLTATTSVLDCGNSGTTMRLLAGLVSAVAGTHHLVGDASLSNRPMDRIAVPLGLMGASVTGTGTNVSAPLTIEGHKSLKGIDFHVPVASAQVKSAILFAGLNAHGPCVVHEDVRTRATTEKMFTRAGIAIASEDVGTGRVVTLLAGRPIATAWRIPGDPSQAAFFCVLGAIHPDAHIEIVDIDRAPERTGFVSVLQRMGANLTFETRGDTISMVARSSELNAIEIHAHEIPSVDEVPVLAVAAAAATGTTSFRDMGELRLKESDRFAGSMTLASSLGCRVWSEGDDFFVEGLGSAERFSEFRAEADLDHRMVMSSAVAGCAGAGCTVIGASTVSSSYPHFFRDLTSLQ